MHIHIINVKMLKTFLPLLWVCVLVLGCLLFIYLFHSSLSWLGCKVYAEHSCQNTFKLHGGYCTVIQSIKGGWSRPLRKGEITQLKTISCWFSTSDLQKFKRVQVFNIYLSFYFLCSWKQFSSTKNRMLLWHGSRLTNWTGILSQGFPLIHFSSTL